MNRTLLALALTALLTAPHLALAADAPEGLAPAQLLRHLARQGGLAPLEAEAPADATLREAILAYYTLVGARIAPRGLAQLDADLAQVPPEIQAPVARILLAMNEAARLRHEAFATVSVADARFAHDVTLRADAPTAEEEARLAQILPKIDAAKMASAAALVLEALEQARAELLVATASGAGAGVAFVDPLGSVQIAGTGDDLHEEDRALLVDLGGRDNWTNNAGANMLDFVIEAFPGCITTGGLDCTPLSKSRNDGALESIFGMPCGVELVEPAFVAYNYLPEVDAELDRQKQRLNVFDLARFLQETAPPTAQSAADATQPDARCLTMAADDPDAWQAAFFEKGILGDGDENVVTVGLDLAGDDRFAPPRVFNDINDGDNAANCDTTHMGEEGKIWARNLTAGGAFAGIGILWDEDGADFYGGRSLTQGTGHVGGVGVLVDRGADSDEYEGVRLAQGAAIFASLGLLYDDGGHDVYGLRNKVAFFNEFEHFIGCDVSTRDGQGRANFNGIAALVDDAGDDTYHVDTHSEEEFGATRDDPTTTQGSTGTRLNIGPTPINGAAALGLGLLWDRAGADSYTREGRADGVFDAKGVFLDE